MDVKRKKSGFTPLEMKVSNRGSKRFLTGFTIVELLTVLAIIAMLVGLLVPALNLVRNIAKETKQNAQLTTIGLALTAFRNDDGDYPPSNWPDFIPPPPRTDYCGAQKLAEALLGWDLLGFHPKSTWRATVPAGYPDPATTPPAIFEANLKERKGPYLERATTNAFRLGDLYTGPSETGPLAPHTFVLCDVFGVRRIKIGQKIVKAGTPILYYRANTNSKNIDAPLLENRIYDARNNLPLVDLGRVTKDGTPGKPHLLLQGGPLFKFFYGDPADPTVIGYIQDPKITARPWPYRPDSYILISAGLDGEYGTKDDIRNFGN